MDIIKSIEHEQLKNKIPNLKVGDTVRVHQRIKEGNRERIQVFEGTIIKKQGGGLNATFTVRRVAYDVGVEKVEVVRVGKARRAKLYYLRDRVGKSAKTKESIGAKIETKFVDIKEEVVEEPVAEEPITEESAEEAVVEETVETPVADEVKEEVVAEDEKEEATAEVAEEVKEEVVEDTKTEDTAAKEEKTEDAPKAE